MDGRLYTGRIYDHAKIRQEYPKLLQICVMRWPPRFINLKANKILHYLGLAPPVKLLKYYQKQKKTEENWKKFVEKMLRYLVTDDLAEKDIWSVRYLLLAGTDVVLLCHEHFDENCHRRLLPDVILTEKEQEAGVYQGEIYFDESVQTKLDW